MPRRGHTMALTDVFAGNIVRSYLLRRRNMLGSMQRLR